MICIRFSLTSKRRAISKLFDRSSTLNINLYSFAKITTYCKRFYLSEGLYTSHKDMHADGSTMGRLITAGLQKEITDGMSHAVDTVLITYLLYVIVHKAPKIALMKDRNDLMDAISLKCKAQGLSLEGTDLEARIVELRVAGSVAA